MSQHSTAVGSRGIRAAVLTVSDTRTSETDKGGPLICQLAEQSGVVITDTNLCKDHIPDIQGVLEKWLDRDDLDVILTTGGTGIAVRDVTIEAVRSYLYKEIDGFGELFRWLSYTEDVGTRAMASRALAGTAGSDGRKLLFVLPGSTGAIRLAMNRLILPELPHLVHEVTKHII